MATLLPLIAVILLQSRPTINRAYPSRLLVDPNAATNLIYPPPPAGLLTIEGMNFPTSSLPSVYLVTPDWPPTYSMQLVVNSGTSTSLSCQIPSNFNPPRDLNDPASADKISMNLIVQNGTILSNPVEICVDHPLPTVTSVSPAFVAADATTHITISGTGLDATEATSVYLGVGEDAARLSITGQSPTSINADVPAGLPPSSTLPLRVLSRNGISVQNVNLTVGAATVPLVTEVSPFDISIVGASKTFTVTITGRAFTGVTSAKLQRPGAPPTNAVSFAVTSSTSMTATFQVPTTNAGVYDLCLTSSSGANVVSDRKIVIYASNAPTTHGGLFVIVNADTLYFKGSTISGTLESGRLVSLNNLLTGAPSISLDRSNLPLLGVNYQIAAQPDLYVGYGFNFYQLVTTTSGMEYDFTVSPSAVAFKVNVDFTPSPVEQIELSYSFNPATGILNPTAWVTELLTVDTTSDTVTLLPDHSGRTIRYSTLTKPFFAGTAYGHIDYPGMIFDDPTDGSVRNGGLALTFPDVAPFAVPSGSDTAWMRHDVSENISRASDGIVRHHFQVTANKRAATSDTLGPFVISAYGLSQDWSSIAATWRSTLASPAKPAWWPTLTLANSMYMGNGDAPPPSYSVSDLTSVPDEVMNRANFAPPIPYYWTGWHFVADSTHDGSNFPQIMLGSNSTTAGSSIQSNGGHVYPYVLFSACSISTSCADFSNCSWAPCSGVSNDTNGDGLCDTDAEFGPNEGAMVFLWDDGCQRSIPKWFECGQTPLQFNGIAPFDYDQMFMGLGDSGWRSLVEFIASNEYYGGINAFKWDAIYLDFLSGTMTCSDLGSTPSVESDYGCYHLITDLQAQLQPVSTRIAIATERPSAFLVNCGATIGLDTFPTNFEIDPRDVDFSGVEAHPISSLVLGGQCKSGFIADDLSPTMFVNRHLLQRFLGFRRGRLPGISYELIDQQYHEGQDPESRRSKVYVTEEGVWAAKNNSTAYLNADADWTAATTATIISVNGVKTVRTKTWVVQKAICDYFWWYGARAPTSTELSNYTNATPYNALAVYATACSIRDYFRRNPNPSPQTRTAVLSALAIVFPGYPVP